MKQEAVLQPKDVVDIFKSSSTEFNSYIRTNFQLFVQWFTFFSTTNYLAIGVMASLMSSSTFKSPTPVFLIGSFFLIQSCIALAACRNMDRALSNDTSLAKSSIEEFTIWLKIIESPVKTVLAPPIRLYQRMVRLITLAVAMLIPCWLGLIAVAFGA